MTQTTFRRWLDRRGEPPYKYARRLGIAEGFVYRLAGIESARARQHYISIDLVRQVSEDSGIPVGVLCEEAIAAIDDPTPPRVYRKKTPE